MGLVVAFLFVAVAPLIYQIEYMTMFKTVQVLSAAHLILLMICFCNPAERDRIPAHHRGRGSPCVRLLPGVPVRLGNHPNTLFWRRALAW